MKFISNFSSRSLFFRYVSNTLYIFIEQIVNILVVAIVGILAARYFLPEKYGMLSYVYSIIALLTSFLSLGMDSILIKEILANKNNYLIVFTSFIVRLFSSLTVYVLTLLLVFTFEGNLEIKQMFSIFGLILIFRTFETFRKYFEANSDIKMVTFGRSIILIIFAVLKIIAIYLQTSLQSFVFILSAEVALLSIFYFILYLKREHIRLKKPYFSSEIAKKLLTQSWPLLITGLMVTSYMRIDQIMIQYVLGPEATGLYSAAVKISEMWYFVPVALLHALSPSLIDSYRKNMDKFKIRTSQLLSILFYLSLTLSIVATIFSKEIVLLLYGESYLLSSMPLSISVWASIFIFLGVGVHNLIILKNNQKILTLITSAGAVINIVLNLILLPKYGIMGASISTLIAYSFSNVFGYLFFPITREVFITQAKSISLLGFFDSFKSLK